MAELAPAGGGGGPNRLFVILAVGLGALLILGLIGVGGIFLLQRAGSAGPPQAVATLAQNTLVIGITTPTRAALAPTSGATTPTEQPTPTFVIISGGATDTPGATATFVLGAGVGATTTTAPGQLPKSGAGDNMLLLIGGIVLVLVVFAARRARFYGGA